LVSLRVVHSDTQCPSRLARSSTSGASLANTELPKAALVGVALGSTLGAGDVTFAASGGVGDVEAGRGGVTGSAGVT
jgi:hypothetical protein